MSETPEPTDREWTTSQPKATFTGVVGVFSILIAIAVFVEVTGPFWKGLWRIFMFFLAKIGLGIAFIYAIGRV